MKESTLDKIINKIVSRVMVPLLQNGSRVIVIHGKYCGVHGELDLTKDYSPYVIFDEQYQNQYNIDGEGIYTNYLMPEHYETEFAEHCGSGLTHEERIESLKREIFDLNQRNSELLHNSTFYESESIHWKTQAHSMLDDLIETRKIAEDLRIELAKKI